MGTEKGVGLPMFYPQLYCPLKILRQKHFRTIVTHTQNETKTKNMVLKAITDLLARIELIDKMYNVDDRWFSIVPIHTLHKFLHKYEPEKYIEDNKLETTVPLESSDNATIPESSLPWLQDGMALIQELKYVLSTFELLVKF